MRIFVSPLDWGLGHAARCTPIIRYLVEKKHEVVIGAEGAHLIFLKEHFPDYEFVDFPGYRISYSNRLPVGVKVLMQLPKMAAAIKKEHELLAGIIKEKKIDAVISDNRYGLWHANIPSVIITHQLNIKAPAGNSLLSKTAYTYIKNFDECWIPDYAGEENLAGSLSHPIPKGLTAKYIGPLSRFKHQDLLQTPKGALSRSPTGNCSPFRGLGLKINDLLVILSGPEPQRTKLEEIILKQLKDLSNVKALIIQGLPGNKTIKSGLSNVEIVPHLSDYAFQDAVVGSEIILSRGGYSTLMDLNTIGLKKSILVPTPGQTEQEYLGELMQEKGMSITFKQKGLLLEVALEKAKQLKPVQTNYTKEDFRIVIDEWIKKFA